MAVRELDQADRRGLLPPTPSGMRRVLGRFATGVTIVTGGSEGRNAGFACQSFASVSLEPPLVLFCADHRGRAWPRIRDAGRFCVNVLAEGQGDLCERFGSRRGRKFDGLDWEVSRWGTPALRGVLARVHADVRSVHVEGDHDVVIGRVLELEVGAEERPMLFYRGDFGVEPRNLELQDGERPRGGAPRSTARRGGEIPG